MTGVKISELPAAGSVAGGMEFEVNDSGTSRKVTGAQIKEFTDQHTHAPAAIDMTGPGLVGRSGSGAGAAEEVTAVAPLTLGSGNASIELAGLTEETSPADADLILLEKAADGAKRKVKVENIGGAPTTSEVLAATAGASAGAVGTYAFLGTATNAGDSLFGATRAGSQLFPAGIRSTSAFSAITPDTASTHSGENSARAGTWRCMGVVRSLIGISGATLWLRIS